MASRTHGRGSIWIILKHLLPNAMSPIIISMANVIPGAIFSEAFLSYIGLGVPLPMASWGMLASDGANKLLTYPYQLLFPGAADLRYHALLQPDGRRPAGRPGSENETVRREGPWKGTTPTRCWTYAT